MTLNAPVSEGAAMNVLVTRDASGVHVEAQRHGCRWSFPWRMAGRTRGPEMASGEESSRRIAVCVRSHRKPRGLDVVTLLTRRTKLTVVHVSMTVRTRPCAPPRLRRGLLVARRAGDAGMAPGQRERGTTVIDASGAPRVRAVAGRARRRELPAMRIAVAIGARGELQPLEDAIDVAAAARRALMCAGELKARA